MTVVTGLVTHADLDDGAPDAQGISVTARLEAVLADGRSVVLLDDRGWSSSGGPDGRVRISAGEVDRTTRMVVGPDEPFGGRTQEQMTADHWGYLAGVLGQRGVDVEPHELERLPHEVVLSERLRARTD
ncbi:hypothetical protein [Streptomyces specialis]|uniref:hypothetical protein n=1 Tax=Streptomyces specialis TaxID=498367 RepID=UPI00073EF73C|nr:hypothetical protein [Streptomyces specialis]